MFDWVIDCWIFLFILWIEINWIEYWTGSDSQWICYFFPVSKKFWLSFSMPETRWRRSHGQSWLQKLFTKNVLRRPYFQTIFFSKNRRFEKLLRKYPMLCKRMRSKMQKPPGDTTALGILVVFSDSCFFWTTIYDHPRHVGRALGKINCKKICVFSGCRIWKKSLKCIPIIFVDLLT